jgi:hypothetical protein
MPSYLRIVLARVNEAVETPLSTRVTVPEVQSSLTSTISPSARWMWISACGAYTRVGKLLLSPHTGGWSGGSWPGVGTPGTSGGIGGAPSNGLSVAVPLIWLPVG